MTKVEPQQMRSVQQGSILTAPDITVIGGGPIGCLAALCLAHELPQTRRLRLITGRRLPPDDGRAAALIGRSMETLEQLGLADEFRAHGRSLNGIRIIDVTGRLFRAPTTTFSASDTGRDEFGLSLTTRIIVDLMRKALVEQGRVELLEVDVKNVERQHNSNGDGFRLTDDEGRIHAAPFIVAADGQRSLARDAAGIAINRWNYPQVALTFAVKHRKDHDDISTEFHTADGPFTLVPAGDCQSTVVWMTNPENAENLLAMDDTDFARAAERTCRSIFGAFTIASPRGSYPMGGIKAETFVAPGIALVGETGHAFPPIGAQGMNLGFRDCETLAKALSAAGPEISADDLEGWNRDRQRDVGVTTAGVDAFNRSLLSDLLPISMARSAGLAALQAISPLRRAVMRAGLRN
jgi:2-octaprenyl-6-methoxyphenol hydroxylase